MFSGVGVGHGDGGVEVVDKHNAGLGAGEGLGYPVGVAGDAVAGGDLAVDGLGECGRGSDEHAGGHGVVFGLADEVVGDPDWVSGVVGKDGDFGGAGFGVDADHATDEAFRGGDVDIAGAGNHVDGFEVGVTIGHERDGLGAADGPHLGDAEEAAGGEDGGVGPTIMVGLGWGCHNEGGDAGFLGGHHVHDDGGGVDSIATGNVEADAGNGLEDFGDGAAGGEFGGVRLGFLVGVDGTNAGDGFFQGGPQVGVEIGDGLVNDGVGNLEAFGSYVVELFPVVECRRHAVVPNGGDHGGDCG